MKHISEKRISVDISSQQFQVTVPSDPEASMQTSWEEHGEDDAFFPFWLEAWPSSYGLFDYIQRHGVAVQGALELGCGCGVFAQLLQALPGNVMHADLVPSACRFTARQLARTDRIVFAMDMRYPSLSEAPTLLFGADLFYEYALVDLVCEFVRNHLAQGGVGYFADPMRPSRPLVGKHIEDSGLPVQKILWPYTLNGKPCELAIWKFSK